jgi:hypothetical protein
MNTHTTRSKAIGLFGSRWTSTGILGKDLVVLEGFGGTVLRCTAGTLWLTLEGDPEDHILTPNQTVYIPDDCKALLSGTGAYECLPAPEAEVS